MRNPSRSASRRAFERLLQEFHPGGDERRHQRLETVGDESLVGIDAEPDIRPGLAHSTHALGVEHRLAREFQLEGPGLRVADRLVRHDTGLIGADRERGRERMRVFESGKTPDRAPRAFRFQVPRCAIERVSRATGRQQPAQFLAVCTGLDVCAHGFDGRQHVRGVVAQVIDAGRFAFAGDVAVVQAGDDHGHLGERVTGDREGRRQRQRLLRDIERLAPARRRRHQ